jgi:DNA-binding CsgD family transcriptional regulator
VTTPSTTLSARDVSAVLRCVHDLHAETDAARLPVHLLRSVGQLIPNQLAGFTLVDPTFGESSCHLLPAEPWDANDVVRRFQEHILDHPVVQHAQRTRDGTARAISDFLTARQFHATGLYRSLFGPMGLEDQLSIGMVGTTGPIIGLSFNRARRGFSARDREVLNLVRPHVLQAYLHGRELQLLRNLDGNRRGTVVDQLPIGLVCVDARGSVTWSTDPAREMLRNHYADAADSLHVLPEAIRVWLRYVRMPGGRTPLTRHVLSVRGGADLSARWCPLKDGQGVVTLQEVPQPAVDLPLDTFGLSSREADAMRCLLHGASVAGTAAQLGIKPRTVEKHLERIFRKLGVNSLSAACVTVLGRS